MPVGGALLIFLMVGSHGAPDLNQEVGVLYCGHLVPLELLLRCLLLQLTFSRDCEGLDRLRLGLVHQQEFLLRVVDGHAELGAHVGLKEHHGDADDPKHIIRDSLYNLQPAGGHVVLVIVPHLAQNLSTRGAKVAYDVNKVDHRVDGHQSFLDHEL